MSDKKGGAMRKFFRIRDLAKGLDGIIAEGEDGGALGIDVVRLYDCDRMVGDRVVSAPVAKGMMWLSYDVLAECDDPRKMEFASDNPWGKCVSERSWKKGDIRVDVVCMERCIHVVVGQLDTKKGEETFTAISSTYFTKKPLEEIVRSIEFEMATGDLDSLPMVIEELHEEENEDNGER